MDNGSEGTSDCDSIKISSTGNSEAGDLSGKQSGICASSETGDYHHADIDSHGCTDTGNCGSTEIDCHDSTEMGRRGTAKTSHHEGTEIDHRGSTETGYQDNTKTDHCGYIETDHYDGTEMDCHGSTETGHRDSTETSGCRNTHIDNRENSPVQHNVAYNDRKTFSLNSRIQKSMTPKSPIQRSPLTELLVYPTPTKKISKAKSCARVLTSADSIAILEEKARKKREEQEEKERRKKERELKKAAREVEKKRKAGERQAKQAEKQKKAEQKGTTGQKRNGLFVGSRSKRQRLDRRENESHDTGVQQREVSKDECAACFGLFEDDDELVEWIVCTNDDCKVWCHAECVEKCDVAYVYVVCQTLLA